MDTRMHSLPALAALLLAVLATPVVDAKGPSAEARPARHLQAFTSEKELKEFLQSAQAERKRVNASVFGVPDSVNSMLSEVTVTGTKATASVMNSPMSITNTQHAGVDEGGIVKLHGDHLVMLRRGRLFTVSLSHGRLRPVSAVNAFGPGMDPDGAWYDELLVSGNRVVVIGYSYARQGTELGLFDIDKAGQLTYRATYHLRSNDYYSNRNYASRLIGDKLIFYSPLQLPYVVGDHIEGMPGVRRWQAPREDSDDDEADFADTASARQIFRVPTQPAGAQVLHTVSICDLSKKEMTCKATGLIGNWGEVFYVSPQAVYVWTGGWGGKQFTKDRLDASQAPGTLFRMPLDGGSPQAIGVYGSPVDQLSFEESGDGWLNVVVLSDSAGNWMAAAEFAKGETALFRLPVTEFGDGTVAAPSSAYRLLPTPPEGAFQNRFVNGKLLYGSGEGWWERSDIGDSKLFVVELESGTTTPIPLPHGVDRIEVMGDDAVVVGERGDDLYFSGIHLAHHPKRAQEYVLRNAAQGETRTHGFFYKAGRHDTGVLGLPVRRPMEQGVEQLFSESASILFLSNADGAFASLGELRSNARKAVDDNCVASCVDWYGNSRPIFIGNRILGLMGYEIVEGRIESGLSVREIQRASFAPRAAVANVD